MGSNASNGRIGHSLTARIQPRGETAQTDTTGGPSAWPNNSQGNTGNPIVNATVVDDAGVTNLNSITINGSLFRTTGPVDCQYVSNANLNQQPFVPSSAPEPAT